MRQRVFILKNTFFVDAKSKTGFINDIFLLVLFLLKEKVPKSSRTNPAWRQTGIYSPFVRAP
jgi:hypothetical protein